jgi:hypothetical protein
LRPVSLAAVSLAVVAVVLVLASPAAAQTPNPPCPLWEPCTPVVGPWLTTGDGDNLYPLDCPPGQNPTYERAVASDGVFPNNMNPFPGNLVGTLTGGGAGVGARSLMFGLHLNPEKVTYKPGIGCAPRGATVASLRGAPRTAGLYRIRVRKVRIHPGYVVRVRRGCAGGERLAHSGSVVAFFTRRPPSPRTVKAIVHRHRRKGNVSRTRVKAPAGVGDNERVELQVTALCVRADRSATAGTQNLSPCSFFAPCTPVIGPWVAVNGVRRDLYSITCPSPPNQYRRAVGSDVAISAASSPQLYVMLVLTSGGLGPGEGGLDFGFFGTPLKDKVFSYQPAVGCLAPGACTLVCPDAMLQGSARGEAAGFRRSYRRRVRSVRIRPGATARVRLGCARGERLVHSGYGVGFFTAQPPSPDTVKSIERRHRRTGRVTRTFVAAPPGVGDDERVELQVTAICARGR